MSLIEDMNAIIWAKVRARFMERIKVADNGCWIWQGTNNGKYPTFHILGAGRLVYAHRLSLELFTEPIRDGNVVMHTCDTPLCVNPAHLVQGTQQENMLDKTAKGRAAYPGMRRPLYGTDNPAAKIDAALAERIRASYDPETVSYRMLSQQFGISKSQVFRIVKGHGWSPPSPESQS